ncbi:MAG: hypothetical protein M3M99_07525 [Actinomycetota bacterium]|nr:hypothetical protein [Actinomycetota bacterium]
MAVGKEALAFLVTLVLTLSFAPSAQGAVLSSSGGTLIYVAGQGERNDVNVSVGTTLGIISVFAVTDADAPVSIGAGPCEVINGVGKCLASGITGIFIDVQDRDDTVEIATGGPFGAVPLGAMLIGGRGEDNLRGGVGPDFIKGNAGSDRLRGRLGADFYKGGQGSDVLQTIDHAPDAGIRCGDGHRDLIRGDRVDPHPFNCELGSLRSKSKD